ncbi:MAG TPA: hypothetical protein VFE46_04995 [Pirellulales bacterium]|jgi:hypothetical protein|nr:hypothetical protein [Pirellulales bacterium]
MKIHQLIWPQDRIEHIATHGVTPSEVEQYALARRWCYGQNRKAKIRFTTFWGKRRRADICFVLSLAFLTATGIL